MSLFRYRIDVRNEWETAWHPYSDVKYASRERCIGMAIALVQFHLGPSVQFIRIGFFGKETIIQEWLTAEVAGGIIVKG